MSGIRYVRIQDGYTAYLKNRKFLPTIGSGGNIGFIFTALVLAYIAQFSWKKQSNASLPPGPPADPIIGHLRILPDPKVRAEQFYAWSRKYGDVFALRVFGTKMIVLNSEKAASELLDGRSAINSDRPSFPISDRVGWKDLLVFLPYGPRLAEQRRLFQQSMAKGNLGAYEHAQEVETNLLLKNLWDQPQEYDEHVHRFTLGLLFGTTYGHQLRHPQDEYFRMVEIMTDLSNEATRPSLLDLFPFLDRLPAWFPGAWWVGFMQDARPVIQNMINAPFEKVKKEMLEGKAQSSFVSRHLAKLSEQPTADELYTLKMVAHMILGGGGETTWHTITTFISCMLLHPEVQAKGQEEIDRVVGRDRLPDFTDRDSLPYIECILFETMRWRPVVPSGIPHKTSSDQTYRGMYIPKGSLIVANTRSLTWDEELYHEPRMYKPDRFLPKPLGGGEVFSPSSVFGWGRRACPGRFFADATLWLAVARIIAVFNVLKSTDTEGRPIEPEIVFDVGLISHPLPFACQILPRDEKATRLIGEPWTMSEAA